MYARKFYVGYVCMCLTYDPRRPRPVIFSRISRIQSYLSRTGTRGGTVLFVGIDRRSGVVGLEDGRRDATILA